MLDNRYDTVYRRLFAKMFDYIIFAPIFWILNWVFIPNTTYNFNIEVKEGELPFVENPNPTLDFFYQYGELSISLFLIFYFVLCHFFFGQTLGKAITNVKVWDVSEEKKITFFQALVRNVPDLFYCFTIFFIEVEYLPFTLLAVWNITNVIQVFLSKKYRSINDLIAKTVVLKVQNI